MVSKSFFLFFDHTCIQLCLCYGVPLIFTHAALALPMGNMYLLFDSENIQLKRKEVDLSFGLGVNNNWDFCLVSVNCTIGLYLVGYKRFR